MSKGLFRLVLDAYSAQRASVFAASALCILIGFVQLIQGGRFMNPDGVSYLDVGKTLLSNQLLSGYSGYWSPLYAVLAAAGAQAAEWAGAHRLAGVHSVNILLFVVALAVCAWMVRKLVASCGGDPDRWEATGLQIATLALFSMIVIQGGGLRLVTPDLLVAGLTMAMVGLTAQIATRELSRRSFFVAGVLMGLGYWAKSIFFPTWWWWLALVFWLVWRKPERKTIVWALAGWLILAGPLVVFTSRAVGRLSFGESGRLNLLWVVNRVSPHAFWEGREAGHGRPLHPLRRTEGTPAVYMFGDAFPEATYPLWYAPSYWYEGARTRVTMEQLKDTVKRNLAHLKQSTGRRRILIAVLFFGLWVFGAANCQWRPRLAALLLALGPCALILIVLELRYIYGNLAAIWAVGVVGLAGPLQGWRLAAARVMVILILGGALLAWRSALVEAKRTGPYAMAFIVERLRQLGVEDGSRICWIGPLAGAGELAWEMKGRVVAQMRDVDYRSWMIDHGELPPEVPAAFRREGCHVAVAAIGKTDPAPHGWTKVGRWPVYSLILSGNE